MSAWFSIFGPLVCSVVYLATAIAFLIEKRYGWALTYLAYGTANCGLVWASIVERSNG